MLLSCTCFFSVIFLKASAGPSVIIQLKARQEDRFGVALAKGLAVLIPLLRCLVCPEPGAPAISPHRSLDTQRSAPKELREQLPGSPTLRTGLASKASEPAAAEKPTPLQLHSYRGQYGQQWRTSHQLNHLQESWWQPSMMATKQSLLWVTGPLTVSNITQG